jgi:hypothetical protein
MKNDDSESQFFEILKGFAHFFSGIASLLGSAFKWISFAGDRAMRDAKDRETTRRLQKTYDTQQVYEQNAQLARAAGFPTLHAFMEGFYEKYVLDHLGARSIPVQKVREVLLNAAGYLYSAEGLDRPLEKPTAMGVIEEARYRDQMLARIRKQSNPQSLPIIHRTLHASYAEFAKSLPKMAYQVIPDDDGNDDDTEIEEKPGITVAITDVISNVGKAIYDLTLPFYRSEVVEAGLFADLRKQLDLNERAASGNAKDSVSPHDFDGSPQETVQAYLKNTLLEPIFSASIPFSIPQASRFEHHWIVAGTGHGKTQTLQALILDDLKQVEQGQASIVVIDSQGDLINNIAGLKQFAAGGTLHDRLCLIDPTDIEYPVALNLFDIGLNRMASYSALDRERLLNSAIEVLEFILSSLLGSEMTARQSTLFRYAIQAMLVIPDATIVTFRELMQPEGYNKHLPHLQKLEGTAKEFFETQFNAKIFDQTKQQVVARLFTICENRTFERLFTNPRTKLNLFDEINSGKVILINTAKDLLKQTGTEVFGRFFIALLTQAAQERATLPASKRLPTFVYIDEAQDYIARDANISIILEQARKQNIGLIVAHQFLAQLSAQALDSLHANTSIKFAGGVGDRDAHALARNMRAKPDMLERQPKGSFAAFVRNYTETAVSLQFLHRALEQQPRMTAAERDDLQNRMRDKYSTARATPGLAPASHGTPLPVAPAAAPTAPQDEPAPAETSAQAATPSPDATTPNDDWRS